MQLPVFSSYRRIRRGSWVIFDSAIFFSLPLFSKETEQQQKNNNVSELVGLDEGQTRVHTQAPQRSLFGVVLCVVKCVLDCFNWNSSERSTKNRKKEKKNHDIVEEWVLSEHCQFGIDERRIEFRLCEFINAVQSVAQFSRFFFYSSFCLWFILLLVVANFLKILPCTIHSPRRVCLMCNIHDYDEN